MANPNLGLCPHTSITWTCTDNVTRVKSVHVLTCYRVTFVRSVMATVGAILAQVSRSVGNAEQQRKLPSVYDGPPVQKYSTSLAITNPAHNGAGTVFDETKFGTKRPDAAKALLTTTKRAQRASFRFFFVAGLAMFEFFVLSSHGAAQMLLIAQGVTATLFGLLGLFACRLSKAALLLGMLVYALDTVFLTYTGYQTSILIVGYAMVVRGTITYRLFCAYAMIGDMQGQKM